MATPTTQDWLNEIAGLVGRPARTVRRGGTEPKEVLLDIVNALALPIDTDLPKPQLAAAIARAGGENWDRSCDSDATPSGGGGTITNVGLDRVLRAVRVLAARPKDNPTLF